MGIGVGVDGDGIRLRSGQSLVVVRELQIVRTKGCEHRLPRLGLAGHDPDDLKTVHCVIGLGMAGAHVSASNDENPNRLWHGDIQMLLMFL